MAVINSYLVWWAYVLMSSANPHTLSCTELYSSNDTKQCLKTTLGNNDVQKWLGKNMHWFGIRCNFCEWKGFYSWNINPSVLICKRWISSGEYIPNLTDFGNAIKTNNNNNGELCKIAESSLTPGCHDHVAPEIKHGDNLSIKTDVYGLGYCLHQIINTAKLLHPSLKFWTAQSLKEKPKKRPPVSKIIERLELIYEDGHFNDTVL